METFFLQQCQLIRFQFLRESRRNLSLPFSTLENCNAELPFLVFKLLSTSYSSTWAWDALYKYLHTVCPQWNIHRTFAFWKVEKGVPRNIIQQRGGRICMFLVWSCIFMPNLTFLYICINNTKKKKSTETLLALN